MPTAILRVLTAEGFVIAADGRQTTIDYTKIVSDSLQKIFPICGENWNLACALCGTTTISADDNDDDMVWDLAREVQRTSESLGTRKSRNLAGYAVRLSRPIQALLEKAKRVGRIAEYPTHRAMMKEHGSTIAEILLDGYYNGIPSRVSARFFHEDQRLCDPEIVQEAPTVDGYTGYGSDKILGVFFNPEDPRLSKYGKPRGVSVSSLENAAKFANGYITACSSPEGHLIDDECPGIGGHIHIATITLNDGFRWVPGFEPVNMSPSPQGDTLGG